MAASGGNHGAAVAYAAMRLGVPAKIFVPTVSSPAKIARIRGYGADLVVVGDRYADALAASRAWAARVGRAAGARLRPGGDPARPGHARRWSSSEQAPELDTVLVAVGGGGLIGGIAAWYGGRAAGDRRRAGAAPTLTRALEAGRPVDAPAGGIAADSLAPRRRRRADVPDRAGVHRARGAGRATRRSGRPRTRSGRRMRVVAEPGGAAAFSALLGGAYVPAPGERVGVVVSGGNTTAVDFGR